MKQKITYRNYQPSDFSDLVQVIIDSWQYDKKYSKQVAKHFASIFLSYELSRATYSQVAVMGQQVVGVILAVTRKTAKLYSFQYGLKTIFHGYHLFLSREGRQLIRHVVKETAGVNQEMLSELNISFQTEVGLFAVSPKTQGTGIGKQLFSGFQAYINQIGAAPYYLYTDTSCNFGFYDHLGMKRAKAKKHVVQAPYRQELDLFIYTSPANA